MAEERLGASFGIDVTNLKAGLAQANRVIKESESKFKAAAAGMDDWRKSQEGLEARITHLTTAQDLQRQKVEALKKQYEEAGYASDDMSAAAVKLRTDINKEEEALAKTERELRKQNEALANLENASEDAEDAVDDLNDSTHEASEGFTIMKGALADLVAEGLKKAIGAAKDFAKEMVNAAAEVNAANSGYAQTFGDLVDQADAAVDRVANATGILRDRLTSTGASIYAFARSSGATTEEAMELMETGLMAAADSAAYYDRSLEDSAETLQSFLKGNFANDAALGLSATEFTRNAKAAELFGKKYNDLTEIEKQKTLLKMVTDSQAVAGAMGQAAREADGWENVQGNLNEAWRQFTASAGQTALAEITPIIKDITKEVGKGDGTLSKASKSINELSKKVLPPVGKAIKFLLENLEGIAKVTFTAVTAFTALSAAMKVTTAITAATSAVKGLTAGVGLATKAQTIWNAAMSANPIGAVITAVALLATGIALLTSNMEEATEKTDLLSEEQREAVTAAEEAAEAYRETKDAATELAGAELANIDHTQNLWKELQNLTDENGKVKEGYEGRAAFILGELNEALGTEYSMNGNVIQSYKDIAASIDDVIEKKKAQILLEAYEDSYRQAVEEVAAAEKARATQAQELTKLDEAVKEAKKKLADAEDYYTDRLLHGGEASQQAAATKAAAAKREYDEVKATLDQKTEEYQASDAALEGYYADINRYETASTLVIEGETAKAIDYLNKLGGGFQTAASTAGESAEKQKSILQQQVVDTEVNARLMKKSYEDGVEGVTEEMVKTAQEQADQAKEEFLKVGGNITKGIAQGAEGEEKVNWTLSGAMKRLIDKAVSAAQKAMDAHSPSRRFRDEVGVNIGLGVAVGVDKSTKNVVTSVQKQVKAIVGAYDVKSITKSLTKALDTTSLLSKAQRITVSTANAATSAYQKQKDSAIKLANAQLTNVDRAKELWQELQTLANENGVVKAGEEGRAKLILGELNNALGIELTMTGSLINGYEILAQRIDDVIASKRAQILLEAHEESYRDAVTNVAAAERAEATQAQEVAKQEEIVAAAVIAAQKAQDDYNASLKARQQLEEKLKKTPNDENLKAQLEKAKENEATLKESADDAASNLKTVSDTLAEMRTALLNTDATIKDYYKEIANYEKATALMAKGDVAGAFSVLDDLTSGFLTAERTAGRKDQKSILEQQVIDTEVAAQLMKKAYESGAEGVTEEMVKTAEAQAAQAKEEFLKVGGNITKGIAEGAEDEEKTNWTLSGAMQRLIDKAVSAAQKAMDAHSPSRRFRNEVGKYIGQGVAVGIDDSTKDVVRSVKNQVEAISDAFDVQAVSRNLTATVKADGQFSKNSGAGGVTVYQTNNYSQAHSRIELYKNRQATAAAVRLALGGAHA